MSINTSRLLIVVWFLASVGVTHLTPSRVVENHFYNSNILLTLLYFSVIVLAHFLLSSIEPTQRKKVTQDIKYTSFDNSKESRVERLSEGSNGSEKIRVRSDFK